MAVPDRWKVQKPRSVSAKAEEARRLVKGNASTGEEQQQPANAAPAEGQQVELQELSSGDAGAPEQKAQEASEAFFATEPASEPEPVSRSSEPEHAASSQVDWEHKYRSLKGKHDADISRLNRIIDEQAKQLEHLHLMLADQTAQRSQVETPAPVHVTYEEPTREEIEEFGPDLAQFVSKLSRKELVTALGDVLKRLEKVEREAAGARVHSQRVLTESFYESMDKLVPEWRQLNTDRDFLSWLNGVDSFTGQTRISLLRQAEEQKDAHRASAFFRAWLNETGRASDGQPTAPGKPGRRDLRTLIAPGKAAPSTGTAPRRTIAAVPPDKQPETIRGADIQAFFARRRVMSPDEFEAGRRVIAQALKEGRVVD